MIPLFEFVLIRVPSWLICSRPHPPIQPIFPEVDQLSTVHLTNVQLLCALCDLCGHKLFAQNKPNSQNQEITATSFTVKDYRRKPPLPDSKKQTQ